MLPENYEAVKALIERVSDYYGPVEENPELEEQAAEMRRLTGRDWDAEEVGSWCFEYWSRASLDETAYYFFHGALPEAEETELAFWKYKPGVAGLDPAAVCDRYRFGRGKPMKALEVLPYEEIVGQLAGCFPGWETGEIDRKFSLKPARFYREDPECPWYTREVRVYSYSDQMILMSFTNVPAEIQTAAAAVLEGLGCLRYAPEK